MPAHVLDLQADVVDLDIREQCLDEMIKSCRDDLKSITEDKSAAEYPLIVIDVSIAILY